MFEILYDFFKNGLPSEAFNDFDPPVSNLSAEQSHHKSHMRILFEIVKLFHLRSNTSPRLFRLLCYKAYFILVLSFKHCCADCIGLLLRTGYTANFRMLD